MHGAQNIARTVVGIFGNIISFGLFLSPVPTFWRIWKNKSTEQFHPYPYLATTMNCIFWVLYGLPYVHPDSILLVTTNCIGLALEIIYLFLFFFFTNHLNRMIIFILLLAEFLLLIVMVIVTFLCFHTHYYRSMFVGIICVIFGTVMYAAPLSIMVKVYKTKSAEFLPFWVCLAGFCNGLCWTTYALLKKPDPYLMVPNGLGTLLGFIQLCVYGYYTRRAKKSGVVQDGDAKPVEVEVEGVI